ncbi:MAG: aldolase/citrate lyase family protein [Chloroflexota bacterium]|nr:aldolase/citrate lyase family protein [Chloroflexota bacterium]
MRQNRVKEKLARGETVFGSYITVPEPALVEVCAYSGLDYVLIDAEHTVITEADCLALVRTAEAVGITPIVRVQENTPKLILRYMETGVQGLIIPNVETAEDVRSALRAMKYPPEGERGLGTSRASHLGVGPGADLAEHMRSSNRETMLLLLVEHIRGVENIEAILDIPGVDSVWVGKTDLSQSLGVGGQVSHPLVMAASDKVFAQARSKGVVLGMYAGDPALVREYLAQGVRMFLIDGLRMLGSAITNYLKEIKGG